MFHVYSDNVNERIRLEQQFSTKNAAFLVPSKQNQTLIQMLRSICFEFFQNNLPVLADKITDMVINTLNMTCSLNLFRDVMAALQKQQQNLKQYRTHLIEMNRAFTQEQEELVITDQLKVNQDEDRLFEEALKGEIHIAESIENIDLHLIIGDQLKPLDLETITEKTMQSDLCESSAITKDSDKWVASGSVKLNNFFYSASSVFHREEWKTDRKLQNDDSKQMNSFKKKGSNVLQQNQDLGNLMVQQIQYDLNRQMYLTKNSTKHDQLSKIKYNKLIKDSIMNSKLKPRRKR